MKKVFLLFLVLSTLLSCNKEVIFTDTINDFKDNRWELNDVKVFKITLEEPVDNAEVLFHFSHVYEPQYTAVPIAAIWQGPDGKEKEVFLDVQLKDKDGNSQSDCAGDVCDFIMPIEQNVHLEKGEYKLSLFNKFEGQYLPNILALGVSIEQEQ